MGETRWVYDESEQVYEGGPSDFKSIQEYLANHWIDVPDEEEGGDMYDKIMAATSWEQLEQYADGLGYLIMEGEEVK